MGQRIDIGIDGGGTGCRVLVQIGDQEAMAEGGPANVVTDPAAAEAAIRETMLSALAAFGLGLEDLEDARIVAGLAGCRLPRIADAVAIRMPVLTYVVDDSVTALEGAFGGANGTLVNLGTGSFFIRRDKRGITHQGGWGFVLGDEGSAAWLGREALSQLMRVEDGRLPIYDDDPLRGALWDACGDDHPVEFAAQASPDEFAALAPMIYDLTSPWAKHLQRRTEAIVFQGLNAIEHPSGEPWALTGGFGDALARRLRGRPAASLRSPDGTALDGALSMARALP